MDAVITLIGPRPGALDAAIVADAGARLNALGANVAEAEWLGPDEATDMVYSGVSLVDAEAAVRSAIGDRQIDVIAQPLTGRRKRLMLSDMDATIVAEETLDEVAAHAGIGAAVATITRRAMAGEIDFPTALRERVAMLTGLEESALETVYNQTTINPGAEVAVRTMAAHGCHAVLVTGGFDYFTARIGPRIGFHETRSNIFEIEAGRLTGRVTEPIFGRDGKAETLRDVAAARGIPLHETMAVGDGANDLEMVKMAGMGVAYRGKPVLRDAAPARLDHADLTGLLYIQGYRRADFVDAG